MNYLMKQMQITLKLHVNHNEKEDNSLYYVMIDGKAININKETYTAIEIYKNALR